MRIIAVEEHTSDPATERATHAALAAEAGYLADLGASADDKPPVSADRPYVLPMRDVLPKAADVGAGRIADMDEHGIDMQVLSYSNPLQLAPAGQGIELAQAANDRLADAARAHPTRFAGFAALPWQNPQAAARELERAVKDLHLEGALLIGRPGQTFLDDERYEPVLAKLNKLRVPLYVHPGVPLPQVQQPYYSGFGKEVTARLSGAGWGWHAEAGTQVIRMILSGTFDRFPDLRVISGHWGEMVPLLPPTPGRHWCNVDLRGIGFGDGPGQSGDLARHESGMLYMPQFEFIHKVIGVDRILYSIDYPYLTNTGARGFLERLPISQTEKGKIAHGNAEALLGL